MTVIDWGFRGVEEMAKIYQRNTQWGDEDVHCETCVGEPKKGQLFVETLRGFKSGRGAAPVDKP
jgi:hypothetical protein